MKEKHGIVICGFPGCGKSKAVSALKDKISIIRVNEDEFYWLGKVLGRLGLTYPKNMILHIKELQKTKDFILLSSDKDIREALRKSNISYHLVYPYIYLKDEYIGRTYINSNSKDYCEYLNTHWDEMIKDCYNDPTKIKYVLSSHELIESYILSLIKRKIKATRR